MNLCQTPQLLSPPPPPPIPIIKKTECGPWASRLWFSCQFGLEEVNKHYPVVTSLERGQILCNESVD